MTKKLLLKWLAQQKNKALDIVNRQEAAAKAELNEKKYRDTGLEALVAEISPKLNEVYDRVMAWHEQYEEILGPNRATYNSVGTRLYPLTGTSESLLTLMKEQEFARTPADVRLKDSFRELFNEVARTYDNVIKNVEGLANAKLGMDYLQELGFDLTGLMALDEKPVETALAVPINTQFLLLHKEADDGSADV
jgi:hypothetical protein